MTQHTITQLVRVTQNMLRFAKRNSTEGATRVTNNDGGREQLRPVSSKVAGARIRCHILVCAVDAVAGAFFVEFEEPPCRLVEASEDLCDRQPELVALYMDLVDIV